MKITSLFSETAVLPQNAICFAPSPCASDVRKLSPWGHGFFLAFSFLLIVWGCVLHLGEMYEVFLITSSFHDSHHYGAYARSAVETSFGWVPLHRETVDIMDSAQRLLSRDPDLTAGFNADRLWASSFLTGMIHYLSFQRIDLLDAVIVRNLLLWCLAIWGAYQCARSWGRDELVGWITAILIAALPTFAFTIDSLKGQAAILPIFLAAVGLHDRWLIKLQPRDYFWAMVGLWFMLLLGSGSWFLFLMYILMTRFFPDLYKSKEAWKFFFLPFLLAYFWKIFIYKTYTMKPATKVYDLSAMMIDNISWLWTFITFGDVSEEKIFSWKGYSFFTELWALLFEGAWWTNPILIFCLVFGIFWSKSTRILTLMAILFFAMAHLPTIVSGWTWHYGYSTAMSLALLSIISGIMISYGLRHKNYGLKFFAVLFFLGQLAWYMIPVPLQYDLFYGFQRTMIHYDDVRVHYSGEEKRRYQWPEWTRWHNHLP